METIRPFRSLRRRLPQPVEARSRALVKTVLYRGLMVAITVAIAFVVTGRRRRTPDRLRDEPPEDQHVLRLRAPLGADIVGGSPGLTAQRPNTFVPVPSD
jgi:hypothetical protein